MSPYEPALKPSPEPSSSPSPRARGATFLGAFCGAFAAVLLALSVSFVGSWASTASATEGEQSPYRNLSILGRALSHIEVGYVEPPDQDELIYGAIRGKAFFRGRAAERFCVRNSGGTGS